MDELSIAHDAARSTDSLLAGAHLCDQVAFLLGVKEATARRAFLGEPAGVVLAMTEWVLTHEGEEGFYPERILPLWAERRGRGAWRTEDRRVEECRHCRGFVKSVESSNPRGNSRQSECPVCRGAGIGLKPLRIASNGGEDLMPMPLPLGWVVATPGALEMLAAAGVDPGELLERHRCGDWGELDEQDQKENERSLENGWRVLSSYRVGNPVGESRVWIITEADRSATTILLPEEY